NNLLDLTTGMTLEAWVKPTAVSGAWRDVIYKGNDNYYLEATSPSGSRPAGGGVVGGAYGGGYGAPGPAAHPRAALAGAHGGAGLRLYVNGALVSSQARAGALATSANPLQIGGDGIYGQFFQGLIDEVRVYNRALNQLEIQSDMRTAVSGRSDTTAPT